MNNIKYITKHIMVSRYYEIKQILNNKMMITKVSRDIPLIANI